MEDRELYVQLFDYYQDLLTEKQKSYFKMYYFLDYSLGEIAQELKLSRNAIYDQLSKVKQSLEYYENILHLNELSNKREKLISELETNFSIELLEELKKII